MTFDDLRALANEFFEWPESSGRQTVTTFSALLFAQHVLQLREKSLGAENSAGVDALPDDTGRDWSLLEATQKSLREHMAIIQKDTALLRQALEALEKPNAGLVPHNGEWMSIQSVAIAALRAALEAGK